MSLIRAKNPYRVEDPRMSNDEIAPGDRVRTRLERLGTVLRIERDADGSSTSAFVELDEERRPDGIPFDITRLERLQPDADSIARPPSNGADLLGNASAQ